MVRIDLKIILKKIKYNEVWRSMVRQGAVRRGKVYFKN
jgi:hypothetical protein